MSGWIKLHREINSHWVWSNSEYLKWWIDILIEANHTPAKVLIKGKLYECNRGEKLYSLDTWAKRWGTNKSKVKRFFDLLQNDKMITYKSETQTTRITICKYESYQGKENESETQVKHKRNAIETQVKPIKECNNNNNEKELIDWDVLLNFFNKVTGKKSRVIPEKVKTQFIARLKEKYTKEDIKNAIINVCKDSFHIETNLKYVTLEFISRADKLDKFCQIVDQNNTGKTNQKLMTYDD